MKRIAISITTGVVFLAAVVCAWAQDPAPPAGTGAGPVRSATELDQLLGPIALYPDPLVGEILPAATLPSQIVQADRYVSGGGDPNQIDQQPWDASVKALARYPTVLKWMDDNIGWTTELGQSFLAQPDDVMNSIQHLRAQAQDLGNLDSTPQENVVADDGNIEILPVDPGLIYVPIYDPGVIYLQRPYGRRFITFGAGFRTGIWLDHDFDWHDHHLLVWNRDHPRPGDWWSRPAARSRAVINTLPVWQPRNRGVVVNAGRGDRGYERPVARPVASVRPEVRPGPARAERPVVIGRPPQSGPLIGIQSAHDARQFSSRGQASRGAPAPAPRPSAPAPHPSAPPPSHPSGGGGGRRP